MIEMTNKYDDYIDTICERICNIDEFLGDITCQLTIQTYLKEYELGLISKEEIEEILKYND